MKVGIISDTHSYIDDRIKHYLRKCNEIWHAGDFGDYSIIEELKAIAPLKGVYGNIDDKDVRAEFKEEHFFTCEGLKIYMKHIAGYPTRYNATTKNRIDDLRPDLVIVGHSHICKVVRDHHFKHIHINPGAAGVHGFHHMRTLALTDIKAGKITDLKIVELGKRGQL